jgi:hypothetical protein
MQLADRARPQGILHYTVRRRGVVVEVVHEENLIVNVGRNALARLLGGDGPGKVVTQIGFGTNGASPLPGDTALTNPYTKDLDGHSYPLTGQVQFDWSLGNLEATGLAIIEMALICSDGSMFSHKARSGAIAKDTDVDLDGTWTILF